MTKKIALHMPKQQTHVEDLAEHNDVAQQHLYLQHLLSELSSAHQRLKILQQQLNCATKNLARAWIRLEKAEELKMLATLEQDLKIAAANNEYALRKRELDTASDKEADICAIISELKDQAEQLCKQIKPKVEPHILFGNVINGLNQSFAQKNATNNAQRLKG